MEDNNSFGLTGLRFSQIQQARAILEENTVKEEVVEVEPIVEESDVSPEPIEEYTEEMVSVLANKEPGRCYLTIKTLPENAIVRVSDLKDGSLVEKNEMGVYDVIEGSYQIDLAADGYESIMTSVIVSAFDVANGYIQVFHDMDKLETPKAVVPIVENQNEVSSEESSI